MSNGVARSGKAKRHMDRIVEPEWLDSLPADNPRAIRSRRDLRRVNRLMSATSLLGRALDPLMLGDAPVRIVEIGAGDGSLLLRLARHKHSWPPVQLELLDLQPVVAPITLQHYQEAGWQARIIAADVFDWLESSASADSGLASKQFPAPIVVANLFLHHFEGQHLTELLHGLATRARAVVCVEPRRSVLALVGSHLLGAIGCNDVTRHDAVVSVRAGFRDNELSALWPQEATWQLQESAAGLFSHRFVAIRNDTSTSSDPPAPSAARA